MAANDIDRVAEKIEIEALASLYVACSSGTRRELGLASLEVADGIAFAAARVPGIIMNRCPGLGVHRPVEPSSIDAVVRFYADHGVDDFYLQLYEEELSAGCRAALAHHDLCLGRAWMKFTRGPDAPPDATTDLRIERVTGDCNGDFARIACTAFELPDAAIPLVAGLAGDPRWSLYVSYDGDEPAGAGAVLVDGEAAWLDWASTRPERRRRGSQGALMAARIRRALSLGATRFYTETGEAVAGDSQHSYRNILKAGFSTSRARANYRPRQG